MKERIEAIHLVALAIDEVRKRGTPQHAQALKLLNEARRIWRDQLWAAKRCPNCGHIL